LCLFFRFLPRAEVDALEGGALFAILLVLNSIMIALWSPVLRRGVTGVIAPETTRSEINVIGFFAILGIESRQGAYIEGANTVDSPWVFVVLESTIGCGGEWMIFKSIAVLEWSSTFLRKDVVRAKCVHAFTFRPRSSWWGGGNNNRLQHEEGSDEKKKRGEHGG
jgi:hypothetical protein